MPYLDSNPVRLRTGSGGLGGRLKQSRCRGGVGGTRAGRDRIRCSRCSRCSRCDWFGHAYSFFRRLGGLGALLWLRSNRVRVGGGWTSRLAKLPCPAEKARSKTSTAKKRGLSGGIDTPVYPGRREHERYEWARRLASVLAHCITKSRLTSGDQGKGRLSFVKALAITQAVRVQKGGRAKASPFLITRRHLKKEKCVFGPTNSLLSFRAKRGITIHRTKRVSAYPLPDSLKSGLIPRFARNDNDRWVLQGASCFFEMTSVHRPEV